MTAALLQFRRSFLRVAALLTLCVTLLPLAGCKKEEGTAAAAPPPGPTPAGEPPAPEAPKPEPANEFKAKWPLSERLVQRLETTADIEVQNPAPATAVKMALPTGQSLTQVLELAFTALKERTNGGHEVEVEVLAITTTNKFGTNASVFTSRSDPKQDPKNNQLASPLRKLVGGKVRYLTTPEGKVEKLEGGPQFRSKGTVGAGPFALAALASQFSDEAIKGWNTLHTGLPEQPVKPGDTWPFNKSQGYGPAALSLDATNTFKGWEQRDGRKVARLDQAGVIAIKPPAGANPSALTVTLDEGAKFAGQAWFDPALGALVESTLTAEFGIKIGTANSPGTASKVKVTVNAKLTDAPNPGATAAAEPKPADAPSPAPAPPKSAAKP